MAARGAASTGAAACARSLYALHDGADPVEYIAITSSNGQALVRDLDYSFFVF
jgi:hypothetical protein